MQEALSDEERSRIQRWETLEASGVLQTLKDPSDYLRSHVIARLMAAEDAQQDVDLPTILEEAAEQGHPTLAEEACRQLEGPWDEHAHQRLGIKLMRSSNHWSGKGRLAEVASNCLEDCTKLVLLHV